MTSPKIICPHFVWGREICGLASHWFDGKYDKSVPDVPCGHHNAEDCNIYQQLTEKEKAAVTDTTDLMKKKMGYCR